MDDRATLVETLGHFISDEVFNALGLPRRAWLRERIRPLVWRPAYRFAEIAAFFDECVARTGFAEAARCVLPRFIAGYQVSGAEKIPARGPLLIASNHPGAYDALIICASLPRDDLKVVASDVPFMRGMEHVSAYMIYIGSPGERMAAVRSMIRHLEQGGALVIFPSGFVDPDPALLPGAHEALQDWSPSLELCIRRVPELQVQPAIISGVLAEACWRNPLVRLPRQAWQRRKLAEFIQVIQQMALHRSFPLSPRASFGNPLVGSCSPDHEGVPGGLAALVARAQELLAEHVAAAPNQPA